jgi:hypothetical protein
MSFLDPDDQLQFRRLWEAVEIARPVNYSLFTFGESDLPYYLVCAPRPPKFTVSVRKGEVKITRPLIITPDNAGPEFENFFESEDHDGESMVEFLLARSAAFKHLKLQNQSGPERIVTDSVEEAVSKLNRQLDTEDEDRVAILTAPAGLGGVAVLRYAAERIMQSAPDNLNELRERGFLP